MPYGAKINRDPILAPLIGLDFQANLGSDSFILGVHMKKLLIVGMAGAAVLAVGSASAADLSTRPAYKTPPPVAAPIPYYNWTGFYIGGNVGVGVATSTMDNTSPASFDECCTLDLNAVGFTGGFQAGYNWQFAPNWVFGVEGDVGILDTKRTICDLNDCPQSFPTSRFFATEKSDFFATIRARFGYAWDRSLIYITGGGAFVHVKNSITDFSTAPEEFGEVSKTKGGWTVGGGIETALWANWTVKAEYLYVDVGRINVVDLDVDEFDSFHNRFHVFRMGLNYRFGGWGKAPVVARY